MKKLILFLTVLSLNSSIHAALPPVFQSATDYRAILESEELYSYLDSFDTIQKIERLDEDLYQLETENKNILIEVIDIENDVIGPRQFKLHFHLLSLRAF